ncbi:LytTR family DNA-binding domain-containing protein [uncultured Sunxiuqinia sp.]|uniref:LytR/AlgR family response regulator transcription factor n=1 Tax=uncultured Sunxiuqinia sp. TaxID=1573825 RepID=UPI0026115269|nr:LytTR family DNA-binding domain-containing protein [uncultured Sunxiuqinia sp.]
MLNNHYRTLIIDDESPARQRMQQILREVPEIDLVGEAANGLEAVRLIEDLQPDLIFLDIQMPGLNGFEVLQQISYFPTVVFCTAYDDYALEAFETAAIDYLVKPVKAERVRRSIEKLRSLQQEVKREQVLQLLSSYSSPEKRKRVTSIPVKLGDRMLLVKLTDISYFISEDKYVSIVKKDGKKYLTDHSLKFLEEKLPDNFIRIHRSILVNATLIHEIDKHSGCRYVVRLDDLVKTKLVSGRNYGEKIKALLEL